MRLSIKNLLKLLSALVVEVAALAYSDLVLAQSCSDTPITANCDYLNITISNSTTVINSGVTVSNNTSQNGAVEVGDGVTPITSVILNNYGTLVVGDSGLFDQGYAVTINLGASIY